MFFPRASAGAEVTLLAESHWRLKIPAGDAAAYRVAQLDSYGSLPRHRFSARPPAVLRLAARVSQAELPGTWGFGWWNDPFAFSLGWQKGAAQRLPALPQAAWFFHASPPNALSLSDDLPAHGFLMQAFRSAAFPALLLAPAFLTLPLLFWRPFARLTRRTARSFVRQAIERSPVDPTEWHTYLIEWNVHTVRFFIDNACLFETPRSPHPPLGVVIWIDNQYMAFPSDGKIGYGTLPTPQAAWLEVKLL